MTLKFRQSLFRIQTRSRSRRHCGGPRPRRLTKDFNRHLNVPRSGSRPSSYSSRHCSNFRLVWARTRRSTRSWPSLFLLFEWIQSSIDQIWSHAEAEQARSTTLRSIECLLFASEWLLLVDDSNEWLLFAGNPGDHLIGVIKTLTKEGFIPHPSLKTAVASSWVISLIFPMFLLSMNLSSLG